MEIPNPKERLLILGMLILSIIFGIIFFILRTDSSYSNSWVFLVFFISGIYFLQKKSISGLDLLVFFVIGLIALPFSITGNGGIGEPRILRAVCLAQIAQVPNCYFENKTWNPSPTGLLASSYGVNPKCLTTPEYGLDGTRWKQDNAHFNCGPQPA
ncbi:MAG: hypothetical protein AABX01_07230 [Candidatus Micrarchaeota archaeon]